MPNSAHAVIYIRVSTDEQAESKLGLEAQLAACKKFCDNLGYEVKGVFEDPGVSGKEDFDKRPGFSALLEFLQANPGCDVVVYSVSRLTRRQSQLWKLLDDRGDYGICLRSATESFETATSMGRAMLGMLGVWAQLEADMISERTKAALAARKARGLPIGAKPLTDLSPRAATRIKYLYSEGYSATQIAKLLTDQNVPTVRGGKKWYETTVRNALKQLERKGLIELRRTTHQVESESPEGGGECGPASGGGNPEKQG